MGLLSALLMLFAPEALMLFTTPAYYDSAWVAGILGYNLMLIGFSYIAIIGITIQKSTKPYGMAMLYATILTIILNIILIPKFGKEGSAMATVFAQAIVPADLFYKGQKVYPIRYKFAEIATVITVLLLVAAGVRFMKFDNLSIQILVKTVVGLLLVLLVFFLNRTSVNLLISKIKNDKKLF